MSRACIFVVLLLASLAAAQSYTITDLGAGLQPKAISASGEVVGYFGQHVGSLAFDWTASQGVTMLPPLLGDTISQAYGASTNGLVAGESTSAHGYGHAVIWLNGAIEDLGTLGGEFSNASGVSSDGKVTGYAANASQWQHAFLWMKSGGMLDLGTLGGLTSFGNGVNRLGQVVGEADPGCVCSLHAFVWSSQTGMVDLAKDSTGESFAYAINDLGQIAGVLEQGSFWQAVVWDSDGNAQGLNQASQSAAATAINDLGQVVGWNRIPIKPHLYAFMWTKATGMQNLNDLIPSGSGWVLDAAYGINDSGQIVGTGTLNGANHAFLLTPTASSSHSLSNKNDAIR
jgi:probable HAF family extracellular repeat protein